MSLHLVDYVLCFVQAGLHLHVRIVYTSYCVSLISQLSVCLIHNLHSRLSCLLYSFQLLDLTKLCVDAFHNFVPIILNVAILFCVHAHLLVFNLKESCS